jgi:hypothetical protein
VARLACDFDRRRGDEIAELLRELQPLEQRRLRQQDRELLPSHPRRLVGLARPGGDDLGDTAEHPVARVVSEGVVDRFEVIDVDHRQRKRPGVTARMLERGRKVLIRRDRDAR